MSHGVSNYRRRRRLMKVIDLCLGTFQQQRCPFNPHMNVKTCFLLYTRIAIQLSINTFVYALENHFTFDVYSYTLVRSRTTWYDGGFLPCLFTAPVMCCPIEYTVIKSVRWQSSCHELTSPVSRREGNYCFLPDRCMPAT